MNSWVELMTKQGRLCIDFADVIAIIEGKGFTDIYTALFPTGISVENKYEDVVEAHQNWYMHKVKLAEEEE